MTARFPKRNDKSISKGYITEGNRNISVSSLDHSFSGNLSPLYGKFFFEPRQLQYALSWRPICFLQSSKIIGPTKALSITEGDMSHASPMQPIVSPVASEMHQGDISSSQNLNFLSLVESPSVIANTTNITKKFYIF